jgi:hypothetical protein
VLKYGSLQVVLLVFEVLNVLDDVRMAEKLLLKSTGGAKE